MAETAGDGLLKLLSDVAATSGADRVAFRSALMQYIGGVDGLAKIVADLALGEGGDEIGVTPQIRGQMLKMLVDVASAKDESGVRLSTIETEDVEHLARHYLSEMVPKECPQCGCNLIESVIRAAVTPGVSAEGADA